MIVSTCGSSFNTVVQAYTGTCGSLTPVSGGCNDANGFGCGGEQASVAFEGAAGTTYYFAAKALDIVGTESPASNAASSTLWPFASRALA